jgi:hypothetical protein
MGLWGFLQVSTSVRCMQSVAPSGASLLQVERGRHVSPIAAHNADMPLVEEREPPSNRQTCPMNPRPLSL